MVECWGGILLGRVLLEKVEMHCKDATEIFLTPESINLFFINPSYVGSALQEYGGSVENHINNVNSFDDYLSNLIKVCKHIEYALAPNGSAFIMLQNQYNIVPKLCQYVEETTNLKVGQLYVWDFSETEILKHLHYEKMGLIVQLHRGDFYVSPPNREYVIKTPLDPFSLKKYDSIGFTHNTLPEQLCEKFVLAFSKEGDTVADIFGGTGTLALVSSRLGRKAVYNDISPVQYEIARARLLDMEHHG